MTAGFSACRPSSSRTRSCSATTGSICCSGSSTGAAPARNSPCHVRRDGEPFAVLPRPAIGIAAMGLLAVRRGVAGGGMDDGEVAKDADLDILRLQIPDLHRDRRLLEERGAVDQRLVGIGTVEIRRQDFIEALDVALLHGVDVVLVECRQLLEVLAHVLLLHLSFRGARSANPECRAL